MESSSHSKLEGLRSREGDPGTQIIPGEKTRVSGAEVPVRDDAPTVAMKSTAPQKAAYAAQLRSAMENGSIAKGNVEIAALLGFAPALAALGTSTKAMNAGEFIKFILTDPNVKISISTGYD